MSNVLPPTTAGELPGGGDVGGATRELEEATGQAVLGTAGVAGIEVTFRAAVRRLGGVALQTLGVEQTHPSSDGVQLTRHDGRVDVSVDIAVSSARPALEVARAVRDNLHAVITGLGYQTGTIEVSVLDLHQDPVS